MLWIKPSHLKFTDLCIYIDAHIPTIAQPGKDPQVENLVYNYLWLLVKALAIKKRMFQNFEDYDGYAFHSASRLFFALRNNYNNQGKVIKGKVIRPIKSCLNYTKALLYPMKVQYQNQQYNIVLDEDWLTKKFDSYSLSEQLKTQANAQQLDSKFSKLCLHEQLSQFGRSIDRVLERSPFKRDSTQYARMRISLLLNALRTLKANESLAGQPVSMILWRLPKSLAGYVRILYVQVMADFKKGLIECMQASAIDDSLLEKIISNPNGGFVSYEE